MASEDQVEVASQLGGEMDDARINDTMKEKMDACNGAYVVGGTLFNKTNISSLYVFETYKRTLEFYTGTGTVYPEPLTTWGWFSHGSLTTGIMAAVLYAGKKDDGTMCAWLLAWCNNAANGMKVNTRTHTVNFVHAINLLYSCKLKYLCLKNT